MYAIYAYIGMLWRVNGAAVRPGSPISRLWDNRFVAVYVDDKVIK